MYKIALHPKANKEIEKLEKELRRRIKDKYFAEIAESPYAAGKRLTGSLKGFYSYKFSYQGVDYRVIYEIVKEKAIVLILMVSTRESLYKKLLRRVRL